MRASGIKAIQNSRQKTVRRNSVFIKPDLVRQSEDVEHISREKRQLRNYWSSVDAAIFSITGHGAQMGLKRKVRRSSGQRIGGSDKNTLQSKDSLAAHNLFNPVGKRKLTWDVFIGLLVIYSVVIIPFRIGFEQTPDISLSIFDSIIDFSFAIDIALTFNTAVDDPQTDLLIVGRSTIASKYLKFWFWIDLLSTIPFDNFISIFVAGPTALSSIRLIRVIRLSRMLKLFRVAKVGRLGNRFENFDINPAVFGLQKMILQIWFVAHLLCCFWHFLATSAGQTTKANDEITWMKAFDYENKPVGDRYSAAFYYVITSMLAIGYGDIYATNTTEMIYAMTIMIVGSILFGAVISQVNRLIESRNPSLKAYKYRMNELRAYLNEKNLPNVLRTKTTVAYRYYLRKKSAFDETEILNDLPTALLSSLVLTGYAEYIDHIRLFKDLKRVFVVKLIVGFRPFQASVGEYVLKQNDVVEELVFIMRGLVQFSTSSDGRETAVTGYSTDGGMFGDFEYYRKSNRFLNYVAMASCNLLSVTVKHFDEAMIAYPDAGAVVLMQLKTRYKNFLYAKASESFQKETGVRVKTSLWVDGVLKSGTAENGDEQEPYERYVTKKSDHLAKHVRILFLGEDGNEEHADELLEKVVSQYYVIPPTLDTKVKWDLLIGVVIVYSLIVIPVQVGFGVSSTGGLFWFEKALDAVFFLDMALSFRTGYNDDVTDALVVVPHKIYRNYFKTWFIIDFFSTVPFDDILSAFLSTPNGSLRSIKLLRVTRLLRLLRLARFAKLRKFIAKVEDSLGISPVALELGKMIIEVIFISHLTACFYWYVCTIMSEHTWYDLLDLRHAELESQYLTTLYWTITTLATVGYGDITPSNKNEQGVTIVIMLLGATVFGYIVSNVSSLMGSFDLTAQRLSEKVSEVEGYLSEKNVPDSLGVGVVKQIKHTFSQMSAFDENSILKRLPTHLSRQIISIKHAEALENISILKYISNKGIILHVFSMMSPAFYDISEPLLNQGSIATDIVFITHGKAQVTRVTRTIRDLPDQKVNKLKSLLMKHGGIAAVTGRTSMNQNQKTAALSTIARVALENKNKIGEAGRSSGTSPKNATSLPEVVVKKTTNSRLASADADGNLSSGSDSEGEGGIRVRQFRQESIDKGISNSKDSDAALGHLSELPQFPTPAPAPMLNTKLKSLQRMSSTRQPAKLLQRSNCNRMETITTHTPICKVGAGNFCGHVSLMTRQKIKASVIAILPCSVFLLSELDITMIVRDMPAVALMLKRAFAHAILAQRSFAKEKIQHQRGMFMKRMRADFDTIVQQKKIEKQKKARERFKKLNTAIMIRRMSQPTPKRSADAEAAPKPEPKNKGALFAVIGTAAKANRKGRSISSDASVYLTPGSASTSSLAAAAKAIVESSPSTVSAGGIIPSIRTRGSIQSQELLTRDNSLPLQGPRGRNRRVAVQFNRNQGFSRKIMQSISSRLASFGKVDLNNAGDIFYDSDDENELDDLSFIKRTMPKKRSLSCQVLGDSSVSFRLVHSKRRARRMSFPSIDLNVWKEERILNMMV